MDKEGRGGGGLAGGAERRLQASLQAIPLPDPGHPHRRPLCPPGWRHGAGIPRRKAGLLPGSLFHPRCPPENRASCPLASLAPGGSFGSPQTLWCCLHRRSAIRARFWATGLHTSLSSPPTTLPPAHQILAAGLSSSSLALGKGDPSPRFCAAGLAPAPQPVWFLPTPPQPPPPPVIRHRVLVCTSA